MLELGSSGSVRGVLGNEHPYREPRRIAEVDQTSASGGTTVIAASRMTPLAEGRAVATVISP